MTIRLTGIENGFLAEAVLLPSAAFISPNNIFYVNIVLCPAWSTWLLGDRFGLRLTIISHNRH